MTAIKYLLIFNAICNMIVIGLIIYNANQRRK